ESLPQFRLFIMYRLAAITLFPPLQIGMHHIALNWAGPDDGHFDDEIVEFARLQPRQHAHLCPAFDLEYTDRIGPADHVVDVLIRILPHETGQALLQPVMLAHEGKGPL